MYRSTSLIARHCARALSNSKYLAFFRLYSQNQKKFNSIEEFNKSKTHYRFGDNFKSLDEIDSEINPKFEEEHNSSKYHLKIDRRFQNEDADESNDINAIIESDPRLANLKPGSPEYKEQLHIVHQDFQKRQKEQRKKFEFTERMKGVGIGIGALIIIIGGHRLFMNREYVKTSLLADITYKIEDSKAKDMKDPTKNTKNINYLVNKMTEEITDDMVSGLKDSHSEAGLYMFGSHNKLKFPSRVNFFDGQLLADVKIAKDLLVVVNEKGQVFQSCPALKEPKLCKLPFKAALCQISSKYVYVLSSKGEVAYLPRVDKEVEFKGSKSRNWLGISQVNNFKMLDLTEKIRQISTGKSHLLLLGESGKLYVASTDRNGKNYGQYGLPLLSPLSESKEVPEDKVYELTNLNHEVHINKDGSKQVYSRKFTSIAAGSYHSIASDSHNNIWTWGRNSYGECGIEMNYRTDFQPIPKRVFAAEDFKRIARNVVDKAVDSNNFTVTKVDAGSETSYIQLKYLDPVDASKDQQILLSFGNGLKGQLGGNRYLHVCAQPQIIKTLLNLSEYSEERNQVANIGIKDISIGSNHAFVTLENEGKYKDVMVFGDNEAGQFGNGKAVKSSKPVQLPKLVEPQDIDSGNDKVASKKKLAAKVNDINNGRLQILHNHQLPNGSAIEQVVVAGDQASAIFYRRV